MQFMMPLDTNACAQPMRRAGEGAGTERLMERLNIGGMTQEKALRKRCFGDGVTGTARRVFTSDADRDTPHLRTQFSRKNYADASHVSAVILGGGTGVQLFPLTRTRATPAVPVGGCYRLIDIPMSNCFNSGINKNIFVMTQFNLTSLNRNIHHTYLVGGINLTDGSVQVLAATQMPDEPAGWFQGTADAIRKFMWILEDHIHKSIDNIVILCGDQLYRMNYMELVQKHVDTNADITISCAPIDGSRASDYGLVKFDHSGRVIQFLEKPEGADLESMVDTSFLSYAIDDKQKYPYIASMGIYVLKKDVLLDILKSKYAHLQDFGSEILPRALLEHNVKVACVFTEYWEDIGTIKSFFDANLALTEQPPKFEFYDPKTPFFTSPRYLPPARLDKCKCKIKDAIISDGCSFSECTIEHSVIGISSRVSSGCELKIYETEEETSKLLFEGKVPIGIGQNTKIRNCIIDMNARIGRNAIIANTQGVQESDHPEEGYIRSGIVVILKNATNATIKHGTVI
uniref:glucose-1-phosphate adenylyltransferase n=1 Tax=Oryza sativa TaxID=4530 RepID=O24224_ORYSA|nr:ADP-glucose pyrophosphorylase large subunit [Oryza sativa Japonica Group]